MQGSKLVGSGTPAGTAAAITGDVSTGLTATGAAQATAWPLAATNNFVSTTAASTGVLLPFGNAGDKVYVYNGGANALAVYPPVGAQINNTAANGAFSVATLRSACFVYASATQLMAIYGA
jgi:hypothetical protein